MLQVSWTVFSNEPTASKYTHQHIIPKGNVNISSNNSATNAGSQWRIQQIFFIDNPNAIRID